MIRFLPVIVAAAGLLAGCASGFGADVAENWQSEYLQFFLYLILTVFLLQRGSPESKQPGKSGIEG